MQSARKRALFLLAPSLGVLMWICGAPWQLGAFFVALGCLGVCLALARFGARLSLPVCAALLLCLSGCGDKDDASNKEGEAPAKPAMVYTNDVERRMADPAYVEALSALAASRMALTQEQNAIQAALKDRVETLEKAAPEGKEWNQADSEYLRLKAEAEALTAKFETLDLQARQTVREKIREGGEESRQQQRAAVEARVKEFESVKAKIQELNAAADAIGTPEAKEQAAQEAKALMAPYLPTRNASGGIDWK